MKESFTRFYILIFLVYLSGAFVTLMDIDATQYAAIAMDMAASNQFLEVRENGHDYLDKPPLLFWVSALSFKVFGVSTFSYKLPSLLSLLLGIRALFALTERHYSFQTAQWASLIYMSSFGMILYGNDVRTDFLLTNLLLYGTAYTLLSFDTPFWRYIIQGGIGLGLAMATKGPLAIVFPGLILISHLLYKKQLYKFLSHKTLIIILLISITISPVLYGLYKQHGMYGIYFYLWEQSFGRITGDNPFVNSEPPQGQDPTYFIHTLFWLALPWSVILFFGIYQSIRKVFTRQISQVWPLAGVVFPVILLSFSGYKLPHYILFTLPFAAVLSADCMLNIFGYRPIPLLLKNVMKVLMAVVTVFPLLLAIIFFRSTTPVAIVVLIVSTFFLVVAYLNGACRNVIAFSKVMVNCWLFAMLYFNVAFLPELISFQSSSAAGRFIKKIKGNSEAKLLAYKSYHHGLSFYAGKRFSYTESIADIKEQCHEGCYIYTHQMGWDELQTETNSKVLACFPDVKVTKINFSTLLQMQENTNLPLSYVIEIPKQ